MEQYIILITAISLTINFISLFVWYVNKTHQLPYDMSQQETDEINEFNKRAMNNPLVLK